RLLRNTSDAGNWIAFRVQGTGALVRITLADGRTFTNHATTSVGYASASEALVRFGLGRATRATRVEVTWPGGAKRTLNDVEGGRIVEVTRP
ncbi:MAG: ASPIC/UnbV domain-containing protein, partial [Bryobacterales bacterium]|nr:ASPIC/UnbV domain-containing protein [Bryobacterales bacterium]